MTLANTETGELVEFDRAVPPPGAEMTPRCPDCGDVDGHHFRCCPRHDPYDVA
jgi:hypothetical protein